MIENYKDLRNIKCLFKHRYTSDHIEEFFASDNGQKEEQLKFFGYYFQRDIVGVKNLDY